jgi:hypothetical protein
MPPGARGALPGARGALPGARGRVRPVIPVTGLTCRLLAVDDYVCMS